MLLYFRNEIRGSENSSVPIFFVRLYGGPGGRDVTDLVSLEALESKFFVSQEDRFVFDRSESRNIVLLFGSLFGRPFVLIKGGWGWSLLFGFSL